MTGALFIPLADRAVLHLTGADVRTFLQGIVTNDVTRVSPARAIYAALLTPQGKFLFDFFIAEGPDGGLLLDCAGDRAEALGKRLSLYKLRADVAVDRASGMGVAALIDGSLPGAPESGPGAAWRLDGGIAFHDPRLARLGQRAIAPTAALEALAAGLARGTAEDYDRHRLALGVPESGRDIEPEQSFALESNLEELNGVDFHKGCYVGQELTARTKHRGTVRKRILPVRVTGPLPAPGTAVTADGSEIGHVCSGRGTRALALLRLDRYASARAAGSTLTADGATLELDPPDWLAHVLSARAGQAPLS